MNVNISDLTLYLIFRITQKKALLECFGFFCSESFSINFGWRLARALGQHLRKLPAFLLQSPFYCTITMSKSGPYTWQPNFTIYRLFPKNKPIIDNHENGFGPFKSALNLEVFQKSFLEQKWKNLDIFVVKWKLWFFAERRGGDF